MREAAPRVRRVYGMTQWFPVSCPRVVNHYQGDKHPPKERIDPLRVETDLQGGFRPLRMRIDPQGGDRSLRMGTDP